MSLLRFAGDRFVGTSTQRGELNVLEGAVFFETDTNKVFLKVGAGWEQIQVDGNLADLLDVNLGTNLANGQVLVYEGGEWVNKDIEDVLPVINSINDIDDVTITSASNNDFLVYDGTNWVNRALQNSDVTEAMVTQHEGAIEIDISQVDGFDPEDYQLKSERGNANGYASLDSSGLVPLSQLPANAKSSRVVANIAARDELVDNPDPNKDILFEGLRVHVIDASADTSVTSGSAGYILQATGGSPEWIWVKTYEEESLDLTIDLDSTRNATTVTVTNTAGDDAVLPAATDTEAGVMSAADKDKLDGIATGADNYDRWRVTVDSTTVNVTSDAELTFAASGSASVDLTGNTLTFSATDTTYTAGAGLDLDGTVFSVDLATDSGLTLTGGELAVASTLAGKNLELTAGVLDVTAAGADTQIQFNDDGDLGASADFTFNATSSTLFLNGILELSENGSVPATVSQGNAVQYTVTGTEGGSSFTRLMAKVGDQEYIVGTYIHPS